MLIGPLGNLNKITTIFIQENAFENVVCKLVAICPGLDVLTIMLLHTTWSWLPLIPVSHTSSLNSPKHSKWTPVFRPREMYVFRHLSFLTSESHYSDVIMSAMASQITRLMVVYSTVYSGTDQRKHQSSTSLGFVRGIHRWPVNSPHKWPVMRKCFHLMTSSCVSYFFTDVVCPSFILGHFKTIFHDSTL